MQKPANGLKNLTYINGTQLPTDQSYCGQTRKKRFCGQKNRKAETEIERFGTETIDTCNQRGMSINKVENPRSRGSHSSKIGLNRFNR